MIFFKNKKGLLFVFFSVFVLLAQFLIISAVASRLDASFFEANDLYEKGEYNLAVDAYSEILAKNKESGNLYYNLGNCFFKLGDIGKAVLNYERAKRLIPRDGDLVSNYDFAISEVKDSVGAVRENIFLKFSKSIFNKLTLNEKTICVSMIFCGFLIIFLIKRFFPELKMSIYFSFLLLVLLFSTALTALISEVSLLEKEAIVLATQAEVRFAPVDSSTTHFTLYAGNKFVVVQENDDWAKIKRADLKTGWILKDAYEVI